MDIFLTLLEQTIASPWLYLVIVVAVALDAIIPLVPGETLVITGGAFVAQGTTDFTLIVIAAIVGAMIGDHATYQIGRGTGPITNWMRRSRMGGGIFRWASNGLHRRGGMLIVAGRFIPGGRTATTFTAGAVGVRRRQFLAFSGVAAVAWSLYSALIGVAGGAVFADQPLLGIAVGVAFGLVVGLGVELVRRVLERRGEAQRQLAISSASVDEAQHNATAPASARSALGEDCLTR